MSETAAAPQTNEAAKPSEPVGPVKTRFHFKSRKEMQKQPDGTEKEVTIPAPAAVEVVLPYLTVADLAVILTSNDEKQIALLLEAANSYIDQQARSMVDEDPEKARTEGLDNSQLTWDFISKIPPATRRGGGIADEVWALFITDYTGVMQHHGKTKEKAETGAKLLSKRYGPVKDQKKIVKALQENLMTWYTNSEKQEELQKVYETLMSKADTLLAKDEEVLMASI